MEEDFADCKGKGEFSPLPRPPDRARKRGGKIPFSPTPPSFFTFFVRSCLISPKSV